MKKIIERYQVWKRQESLSYVSNYFVIIEDKVFIEMTIRVGKFGISSWDIDKVKQKCNRCSYREAEDYLKLKFYSWAENNEKVIRS